MRKRRIIDASKEELLKLMKEEKYAKKYRKMQCIQLAMLYPDMTAKEIGEITQYSERRVWEFHTAYRKNGIEGLVDKRGGRFRENMTFNEEAELLAPFEEQSKSGKLVVAGKIKLAYEEKIGREVAKSTIYRMLDRHGFRKIVPYKRHPKANKEEQEAFKKTLQK